MTRVSVMYGRIDVEDATRCPRCTGSGRDLSGACPICNGGGRAFARRAYAYATTEKLNVGDIVLVPGSWVSMDRPQEATVVDLTSDYDGPVSSILKVIERA